MLTCSRQRLAEDILPAELWGECWLYVNVKDIWSVRLVCKEFARTSQPFLYRALHCWSPNQEDVDEKNWDMWCKHFLWSAKRFVVVATGSFVYYVEEWSFSGIEQTRTLSDTNANLRGIGVLIEAYTSALTIFLNTLPLYPNLHTITLTSIKVDKDVFDALSHVPKLKNLALVETNSILRPNSSSMSPWPLQKLRILTNDVPSTETPSNLVIISPIKLEALILHSYEFSEACLRPLVEAEKPLNLLTHLSLNLKQDALELLRDIVQLCPALRTLEIYDFNYKDSREIQYPRPSSFSRLPYLRQYHGPAYLAARTLVNLPFESLSLHTGKSREYSYTYSELYKLLRSLSNQVPSHLSFSVVEPELRLFDILASIFSSVRSLCICFNDPAYHGPAGEDSAEPKEVRLKNQVRFMWPVRPSSTLMVRCSLLFPVLRQLFNIFATGTIGSPRYTRISPPIQISQTTVHSSGSIQLTSDHRIRTATISRKTRWLVPRFDVLPGWREPTTGQIRTGRTLA